MKRDLSVSPAAANVYSLATGLPPMLLLMSLFLARWGLVPLFEALMEFGRPLSILPALVVGTIVHELIHGLAWAYFAGKPWSAIHIGFQWKTFTPYAHCREPMDIRAYRLGGVMPGLVLGIIPAVIGILTGNGWLHWFGLLFTLAAGGDFLVLWLLRGVRPGQLVEDHPTRAGCYVLEGAEQQI
jgi:hypothetical protein